MNSNVNSQTNNLVKSYDAIVEKCREPDSRFGYDIEVYLEYLPFEYAKEFLLDHDIHDNWDETVRQPTRENLIWDMGKYLHDAWYRVEFHNDLIASKDIVCLTAWLWLLGDTELYKYVSNENNYSSYGAPLYQKICAKYELMIPMETHLRNLMRGEPCSPECEDGCIKH